MAVAAALVICILALGNWWWNAQAADLKHTMIYSAPPLNVSFDGTDRLTLRMDEDFWHKTRKDQWSMPGEGVPPEDWRRLLFVNGGDAQ